MIRCSVIIACCVVLTGCGAAANWETETSPIAVETVTRDQRSVTGAAAKTRGERRKNTGYHRVVDGDTLYSIAWRYQLDYRDVARWNGRENSSLIYSGERLRLKPPAGQPTVAQSKKPTASDPGPSSETVAGIRSGDTRRPLDVQWQWPAVGTVSNVSYGPQSKLKGVLISGKSGQVVNAAAGGTVVYIGSGLPRYGQVVILKHSDNLFSAYAHVENVSVQQGQWVTAGRAMASMGKVEGSNKIALRFDIRDGKQSLDPISLLPSG